VSRDVDVHWTTRERPRREDVRKTLEHYLGGAGEVRWDAGTARFYATLPGRPTHPFAWDPTAVAMPEPGDLRLFEVWPDPRGRCLCVITRMQDEFTNNVAAGFAALCARRWRGRIEE
jgi:hypothetical protein